MLGNKEQYGPARGWLFDHPFGKLSGKSFADLRWFHLAGWQTCFKQPVPGHDQRTITIFITNKIETVKLIPITTTRVWNPERELKKRFDLQMKRLVMTKCMKPLQYLLSCLNRNPKDTAHFKLVLKENIRRAFKGRYPAARIDYSRLIVSKGKLPIPPALTVSSAKPGQLVLTWNDNSGSRHALESDYLFVALFNRSSQKWLFEMDEAERSAGYFEMNANGFLGKLVHVYAGFVSGDSCRVSTSVYLGELQIMKDISCLRA
jgi:hypothetical protein